jgi:hypothetical protein
MRYLTPFYILFFCILISCNNKKKEVSNAQAALKPYPHIVDMEEGLKTPSQIKLSEIADSIRYIVLSKDKKVIVGSPIRLQLTEKEIFMIDENLVMRFDLNGNFLNSFGSTGRGPEEYLNGSLYSINPAEDKVLILRSMMQDYLLYKPNGVYLGKNKIKYSRNLIGFASLSDSVFLQTFWFHGAFMKGDILSGMSYIAGIFDPAGKPIKVIEHPLKNIKVPKEDITRVLSQPPNFTFFDNRVVLAPVGDTIYEIDRNSIIPGFIIYWGTLPHNQTVEDLYYKQTDISNKVVNLNRVFETSTKAYFLIYKKNDSFILEYDKITGLSRSVQIYEDQRGLINDLDGGSSFFPEWTNKEGDIWISCNDAIDFKEKQSDEFLSKSTAIYPEMKEKLRTLIKDLKPDDNPVLRIVYLKKYNGKK